MLRPLLAALALASLLVACNADVEEACVSGPCGPPPPDTGTGGSGGAAAPPGDYPCDVYAIIKAKCFFCHVTPTMNGAPFPLLTWEDTQALYGSTPRWQRMTTAISSGFMPILSATLNNPDLTPEEQQALLDWLNAGAVPELEGQGCDCDDPAACP